MPGAIPDEVLDDIRERVDIVELASEYLSLKKTGDNFKALCPFHTEKTASFVISRKKQIFHCFGCGVGGNVYSLIMKMEGLDFPEAVERLAKRCGVSLPTSSRVDRFREELYRINAFAQDFYSQNLRTKEGQSVLKYLQERGLNKESISSFTLGYAPSGWTNLLNLAISKGFKIEEIERAGLIIKKEQSGSSPGIGDYYDRFRERLIFPICDIQGQVVGFGGRILKEGEPKYLNSPETPIYNKGQILYGLNLAKTAIREAGRAIIVEGYMDVILCHQYGFINTVGVCGTALTEGQIRLLRRYTQEAILIYDPDPAGMKAVLRGMDLLNEEGFNVKIVELIQGSDPADFLKRRGVDDFKRSLDSSEGLFEYRLGKALEKADLSSPEEKAKVVEEVIPTIVKTKDQIQVHIFIKRLAEKLHLAEEVILSEVRSRRRGVKEGEGLREHLKSKEKGIIECERDLVRLMLLDEDIRKETLKEVDEEEFQDGLSQKVIQLLKNFALRQEGLEVKRIIDLLEEEGKAVISSLILEERAKEERMKLVRAYLLRMRENRLNKGIRDLKEKIAVAEKTKDKELGLLLNQYQRLVKEVRFLKQGA
ncbi:TPA: DNA primase [bacterium]|nr:DNA primase [bacterium]